MSSRPIALAASGLVALTLAACAGAPAPAPATEVAGRGEVVGAVELDEPALGLTAVGPDGTVRHLDLEGEVVTEIGKVGEPVAMHSDGRYLFTETAAGVEIVDSGVWTWDHNDHSHFYRSEARVLGTVPGAGPVAVATSNSSTSGGIGLFFAGSGEAVLLDSEALSDGEIVEHFRLDVDPHPGLVVPVGSHALVTDDAGTVVAYDGSGIPTGPVVDCADAAGTLTTRLGAVIGCSDGALLASASNAGLTIEHIPYPAGANAPAATSFANREGRPTVAALAGDAGIWLLDTRERSWMLLPAPAPLVTVTAVDDAAGTVLALGADGRVHVLDAGGAVRASTEPLVAASFSEGLGPTLIVDQQRAYLAGPAEGVVYEIDFAGAARISRTFGSLPEPAYIAETGR